MNEISHPTVVRQTDAGTISGPPKGGAAGRVLVIDDDDAVGLVLSRAISRFGFKADVALEGPSGLALFNANPGAYGLLLLDFKLPGMDSGTVYQKIRAERADLPVVLMSGYNKQEALDKSAGMELAGFLHKPFTMETLAAALRFTIVS
jgi:two-component system, cell cycle sensor histidine kinase and response regulator CckA